MKARKWLTNSPEVLTVIPQGLRAFEIDLNLNDLPSTKTLGIQWSAEEDVSPFAEEWQKLLIHWDLQVRSYILRAKILIQDMWTIGLGWDEPITHEISIRAKKWILEFEDLKEIEVP